MTVLFNPLLWLVLAGLAIWYVQRTREDATSLSGPRRLWRMLAIGLLVVFVAGFGICGGWGTVVGLSTLGDSGRQDNGYGMLFLIAGGLGLVVALGLGYVLRRITRPRPPTSPSK